MQAVVCMSVYLHHTHTHTHTHTPTLAVLWLAVFTLHVLCKGDPSILHGTATGLILRDSLHLLPHRAGMCPLFCLFLPYPWDLALVH